MLDLSMLNITIPELFEQYRSTHPSKRDQVVMTWVRAGLDIVTIDAVLAYQQPNTPTTVDPVADATNKLMALHLAELDVVSSLSADDANQALCNAFDGITNPDGAARDAILAMTTKVVNSMTKRSVSTGERTSYTSDVTIPDGTILTTPDGKVKVKVRVLNDGIMKFYRGNTVLTNKAGTAVTSLSAAAKAVVGHEQNGWTFWMVDGKRIDAVYQRNAR